MNEIVTVMNEEREEITDSRADQAVVRLGKIKKSALISLARREALWKLVNYIIQNRRKLVKWNIYQDMTNGKHRLRNRNLQHIVIAVGVRCMKEIISIR